MTIQGSLLMFWCGLVSVARAFLQIEYLSPTSNPPSFSPGLGDGHCGVCWVTWPKWLVLALLVLSIVGSILLLGAAFRYFRQLFCFFPLFIRSVSYIQCSGVSSSTGAWGTYLHGHPLVLQLTISFDSRVAEVGNIKNSLQVLPALLCRRSPD